MEPGNFIFDKNHAVKILSLTCDTLILLQNDGTCVDIIFRTEENPYINKDVLTVGKNLFDVLPPETSQELKPEFERVVQTGTEHNANYDLPSADRTYYFKTIIQQYDSNLIIMQYRDITQRSQMRKHLQDTNLKLRETERAAKIGQWSYNTITDELHYSGFIGLSTKEDEVLDTTLTEYRKRIHPEDWETLHNYLKSTLTVGKIVEYRLVREKIYFIRIKIINIYTNSKNERIVEGYAQNVNDIIEKRSELEIITLAVNNSSDNIYATKMDGTLIFVNLLCRSHNRIEKEVDITQFKAFELLDNIPDKTTWDRFVTALKDNNGTLNYICNQPYPVFDTYTSDCTSYIIKNSQGEDIIWSFRRNITKQLRYEQALKEAKEKAEESDRLKSAFISNMSHEIRTPLNAIVGFSGIMVDTDNSEDRKRYQAIIESNNNQLLLLINEILDLSKIESGVLEFSYTPVNIHLLCQEMVATHQTHNSELQLIYDKWETDIAIQTDKKRLTQVLSNLIVNAIKFTPAGEIHFGYRRKDHFLEFYVQDTGIGIPEDKLSLIFNRFIKIDTFAQGTGLGLSICKTIVEKFGGDIFVSSTLGEGSEFLFRIPIILTQLYKKTIIPQHSIGHSHAGENTKSTILVAEDIDNNYELIEAMIGDQYLLIRAKDGKEAVEMQKIYQPDMLLMDIKMPGMDGLEAINIIRKQAITTPIIAISSYAYDDEKSDAFKSGCSDFLSKPLNKCLLLATIKKYLE